jgi:hypothetical protein
MLKIRSRYDVIFNILLFKRPREANGKKNNNNKLLPISEECKKKRLLLLISFLKKKVKKKLPKELRPKKRRIPTTRESIGEYKKDS